MTVRLLYFDYGMNRNKNFGKEYEKCRNGMERKNSPTEWKIIFHPSIYQSITDFVHDIYKKNI